MTRINTNVGSLVARRALDANNASLNQSLQRLSTGLQINTGKDDPAGLIASESLRSSLVGISAAIDNATRADTIVSIAEGGLQEISSLLLELEGLVDESANIAGLNDDEVAANQSQINTILSSIDRLANQTAFGDKKLLNGNFDFTTSGVNVTEATGATVSHLDKVQINAVKVPEGSFRQVNLDVVTPSEFAYISAVGGGGPSSVGSSVSGTTIEIRGTFGSEVISFASGTTVQDVATAINGSKDLTGVSAVVSGAGTSSSPFSVVLASTDYGSDAFVSVSILNNASTFDIGGSSATDYGTDGTVTVNGAQGIVKGLDVSVRQGSLDLDLRMTAAFGSVASGSTSFEVTGGGAVFSISPTVGLSGQETLGVAQVSTGHLGDQGTGFLSSLKSGQTNDLDSGNFSVAQRVVRAAINQVSTLRGRIGAFQKNTLSTTINSLRIAQENVTAAESAIRDADFAVETSIFYLTRAQILVNSSTVTLQLANAQPQSALQLLG